MINILIEFVFWFINKVYSLIMNPLISLFISIIPNGDTYFNSISSFVTTAVNYCSTVCSFLLIPSSAIVLLVGYLQIKLTIIIAFRSYKLIMNLYERLKP